VAAEADVSRDITSNATAVLVVDDDEHTRFICAVCLERAGFIVDAAASAHEALAVAASRRYAVVLSDLSLPDMGGWEMIRRLKAGPAPEAEFVVMTGYDDVAEVARRAGCAYLVKPVPLDRLIETVRSLSAA
jgi:CheY-like chemotaxis protein